MFALLDDLPRPLLSLSTSVPRIGFGTAGLGHATEEAVSLALTAGYRHIDTAQVPTFRLGLQFQLGVVMVAIYLSRGGGGGLFRLCLPPN